MTEFLRRNGFIYFLLNKKAYSRIFVFAVYSFIYFFEAHTSYSFLKDVWGVNSSLLLSL